MHLLFYHINKSIKLNGEKKLVRGRKSLVEQMFRVAHVCLTDQNGDR